MNNNRYKYILLFFALNFSLLQAQQPGESFTLQSPPSGTRNYIARDYINLLPGFEYTASNLRTFSAKVDQWILLPPTRGTYANSSGVIVDHPGSGGVVGAIPGNFAVSPSGAATYTIPIEVPPGVNGMQPNVSLVYNSQAGQGYLGWGWSLGGMSAISRTGKTLYHDGFVESIQLDLTDNLMLDGQRLIRISGNNLTRNAEYRTEAETFSQITYMAPGIRVRTKQGLTLYYGTTNDSRLTGTGNGLPVSYLLKRVTDANGNYMIYDYYRDEEHNIGEVFLQRIRYGGNSIAGTQHFNTIEFGYTFPDRWDFHHTYIGDARIIISRLLREIRVKSDGEIIRRYELRYYDDAVNTRLREVILRSSTWESYNSTVFSWDNSNNAAETYQRTDFPLSNSEINNLPNNRRFFYGDFNGDGVTDILVLSSSNSPRGENYILYRFSFFEIGSNTAWTELTTDVLRGSGHTKLNVLIGDFTGNGFNDFIFSYRVGSTYRHEIFRNTDSGFATFREIFDSTGEAITGDFDGDGRMDLIFEGEHRIRRFTTASSSATQLQNDINWSNDKHLDFFHNNRYLLDFNGDGKTDLYIADQHGFRIYTLVGNGNDIEFEQLISGSYPNYRTAVHFGDFNGDGKTDILTQRVVQGGGSNDNETHIHYSTGTSLVSVEIPWLQNYLTTQLFVGDFNGDGRSDIALLHNNRIIFGISTNARHAFQIPTEQNRLIRIAFNEATAFFGGFVSRFHSDGRSQLLLHTANAIHLLSYGRDRKTLCITNITDGMGQRININYGYSSQSDLYTIGATGVGRSPVYPVAHHTSSLRLVRSYSVGSHSNLFHTRMEYFGAHVHLQGRGFLGFDRIEAHDMTRSIISTTRSELNNTFFFKYPHETRQRWITPSGTGGDIAINTMDYTIVNKGNRRYFLRLDRTVSRDNLSGLSTEMEYKDYDEWFNPQTIVTTKGDIVETQTINYIQRGAWIPNRPLNIKTERTYHGRPDPNPIRVEFTYDDRGNLTRETRSHGDNQTYRIVTEYRNYNAFGQPQTIAVTASGTTRTTARTFHQAGRFMTSSTNVLGERTTYQWGEGEKSGLLLSSTDHYGRTTSYTYDSFGRLIDTRYPDGIRSNSVLRWADRNDPNSPDGARYFARSQVSGRAPVYVWYNDLGQEIVRESYGLNEQKIRVFSQYNPQGRLWRVSAPTFAGEITASIAQASQQIGGLGENKHSPRERQRAVAATALASDANNIWDAVYTYDQVGRIATITTPMGVTTYAYGAMTSMNEFTPIPEQTTTIQTPEGTTRTTINRSGMKIRSEVNEKIVRYAYHPSGLLREARPDGGLPVTMEYDPMGRRIKLNDPNAGIVRSQYNGFGELLWTSQQVHTAGDSVLTTYNYLPNGLLQNMTRTGQTIETTTYTYDNRRRLLTVNIAGRHRQHFTYDDFDRVINVREVIGDRTFERGTEFDNFGRIAREIYPTGFYTRNIFDQNSNLIEIRDSQNRLIWKPLEENARGQIIAEKRGTIITNRTFDQRGFPEFVQADNLIDILYEFDQRGNLVHRDDYSLHPIYWQEESFEYDQQNRLTDWMVTHAPRSNFYQQTHHSQSYDRQGNIKTRSCLENFTMNYGEGNGKPHALTSIEGLPTDFPAIALAITYTDFKKVETLSQGTMFYQITYGVDRQRRRAVFSQNGLPEITRYYFGDYEEKIDHTSQITERIHYLRGAVYITRSDGTSDFFYTYTDFLGSLKALVREDGTVAQRYAYDPWGNRRNPYNWTERDTRMERIHRDPDTGEYVGLSFILNRGYTGHEHIDEFGIINMNGRVYDPLTAQFFSPDPFIQAPDYWLNFNRYSYVLNNPFKYTDPTGEKWHLLIGALVGGVANWASNGFQFNMQGLSYFGAGAASGFLTALAPGASVLFAGGLTATNSIIQQGFDENVTSIDWGQVAGAGVMGMGMSIAGGAVGGMLGADKWFSGVNSPILKSWLQNASVGTATGAGFGGVSALLSGENVWQGMAQGGTMGFITGSISGIGEAAQFSLDNNVSMWTGKYNKPLYHYTTPDNANLIMGTQLGRTDDSWTYLTTDGLKTPLRAQVELSLPSNNNAEALIMVKPNSIHPRNIIHQGNVTGNVHNRGGGGFELIHRGTIETRHLLRLR